MASVIKRENMTISIREYTDNHGNQKKVWKTIGELITWDDGNQSFELWGAGGYVKGSVFEQQNNQNQGQQGYQQPMQQPQYVNQKGQPLNPQQVQAQQNAYAHNGGSEEQSIPF